MSVTWIESGREGPVGWRGPGQGAGQGRVGGGGRGSKRAGSGKTPGRAEIVGIGADGRESGSRLGIHGIGRFEGGPR